MKHEDITKNAKPGAGTPGFARSAFRGLVAGHPYNIEIAGANACLPIWVAAFDCFARGISLLWGGLQ